VWVMKLERSEKNNLPPSFFFMDYFSFSSAAFHIEVACKDKKELWFRSYHDLENILVNVNIHRSWHVL